MSLQEELNSMAESAKVASSVLAQASAEKKNSALKEMANALRENMKKILDANAVDVEDARNRGVRESLVDRLSLDEKRIEGIVKDLESVIGLEDPVGEIVEQRELYNGMVLKKVRVPLGVVGLIYESRPNVSVDASALCLKSGNAIILRGGSDALNSNRAIVQAISSAVEKAGLPKESIQLVDSKEREAVNLMLKMHGFIDVIIPRGSGKLIRLCLENSTVPVIETGEGNCHIFVDESADLGKAEKIVINAKTQRPGVCNAVEHLLIHEKIAEKFIPKIVDELKKKNVEVRGDEKTQAFSKDVVAATDEDWGKEYLDLIIGIKVVESVNEAIDHINKYSTKHSEAIISQNEENISKFKKLVDSAAVYSNASTRFTDGAQFGQGMEIGISTQKLHARGPMSLRELTSIKFDITGSGQVRE